MSFSYEDYCDKSKTYHSLRRPLGAWKELDFFRKNEVPLSSQHLVDAGCGTGSYMEVFSDEFGKLTCFDYNTGMVEQTQDNLDRKIAAAASLLTDNCYINNNSDSQKDNSDGQKLSAFSMSNLSEKVKVYQGDVCDWKILKALKPQEYGDLSLGDNSVDAICNNQVVHHLRPDNDFADFRRAVKEFWKMLKPGGRVVINWSPSENVKIGMWWAELIPKAFELWAPRTPSREKMMEILQEAGFGKCGSNENDDRKSGLYIEPILDEILYDSALYGNPENYIDINCYKRSDSNFNLATEEELQAGVQRVKKMRDEGTLAAWFEKKEAERKQIGQTCNIYAIKPKKNDREQWDD